MKKKYDTYFIIAFIGMMLMFLMGNFFRYEFDKTSRKGYWLGLVLAIFTMSVIIYLNRYKRSQC